MITLNKDIHLNFEGFNLHNTDKPPVIFLHGFSNTLSEWDFLKSRLPDNHPYVAVDLIGHGKSPAPSELGHYSPDSQADQLEKIIRALNFKKVILAGYSMGGRLAINFAVKYSDNLIGLILESSTPGIEDEVLRRERIRNDNNLAAKILKNGVDAFVQDWIRNPLFENMLKADPETINALIKMKKNNSAIGLANSLKGFGTGRMPSYWNDLKNIKSPVILITGASDKKFTSIAQRAVKKFPGAAHSIIPDCGHNTHFEKPDEFITLVNNFLTKF